MTSNVLAKLSESQKQRPNQTTAMSLLIKVPLIIYRDLIVKAYYRCV